MARRKGSKTARGGPAATPRGSSRVEQAWARDVAGRNGRFTAPLLRRGTGLPGWRAGTFSRAVRRGLVMPRALLRPRLATLVPVHRAGSLLPLVTQHTEMGLSHHHLYTLLAWLASRYDVVGERVPDARPGRNPRSDMGDPALAALASLLSGAAAPSRAPTTARASGQPRVASATRRRQGWGASAGFLPVPAALRFARSLSTIASLVPTGADSAGERPETGSPGSNAGSSYGSIIAGPWLATRPLRVPVRVAAIRPPTEMVRSPHVVEHLSAASGEAAPSPGARTHPEPSRRTLSWSAAMPGNDQPGRPHGGAVPLEPAPWRPTFLTVGALSLATGLDSPKAVRGRNAPVVALRRRPIAPAPLGISPGLQRTAVTGAALLDRPPRGSTWSAGTDSMNLATPAPGRLALALSRDVFMAPDTAGPRAPSTPLLPGQPPTLGPAGVAPWAAQVASRPVRPATAAAVADAGFSGADSVAGAGLGMARASRSQPTASMAEAVAAAALPGPDARAPRAARAHSLLIAPLLPPLVRPASALSLLASAPHARPALRSVAWLSTASSRFAELFGLAAAQMPPGAPARPAPLPLAHTMAVRQRLARGAVPTDMTPALVPAATRPYVEDEALAGFGAARLPSRSAREARTLVASSVTPGTQRDQSAVAGVMPPAVGRLPAYGRASTGVALDATPAPPFSALGAASAPMLAALMERREGPHAAATPFAALSRTLALLARIQHMPGARSLRAASAVAGLPMSPLSGALRRAQVATAEAQAGARVGLPRGRREATGAADWPLLETSAAAFAPGRGVLTPSVPAFVAGVPTVVARHGVLTAGVPAFGTGPTAFAAGRDTIFSPGAVRPRALIGLPDRALVPTLSSSDLVSARSLTLSSLMPRGILGEPVGGGREPAAAVPGRRRRQLTGVYPEVASYAVGARAGVPALNVQRSAVPSHAADLGAARAAGEPGATIARLLWRPGASGQLFLGRDVTSAQPAPGAAAVVHAAVTRPATFMEPPESAAHDRRIAPVLAPVSRLTLMPAARLTLMPAARLAAALSSRFGALSFGPDPSYQTTAASTLQFMIGQPERVGFWPNALTQSWAGRSRQRVAPAHGAQALPSVRPSLLPLLGAVPVVQRLTVGTVPNAAMPTLTSAATAALPTLVPRAIATMLFPTATQFPIPVASISAPHGATSESRTTAAGAPPAALARSLMRGVYLPDAALAPSLLAPEGWRAHDARLSPPQVRVAYSFFAPRVQRVASRAAIAVPMARQIGRRTALAARFASLSPDARARRAIAGDGVTPRGRGLISPSLVSLSGHMAAPGMQLSAVQTAMHGAGLQDAGGGAWNAGAPTRDTAGGRLAAEPSGAGRYDAGSIVGISATARAGRVVPVGRTFAAHPLVRVLAPLSRILSPARIAAAALPLARRVPALPLLPRALATAVPAMRPALLIQRKALAGAGEPSPLQRSVAVARAAHSRGHPLDAPARALMETALGRDLAPIQLHTDAPAGEAAAAVGARAFTLGRDVFFAPGAYQPRTPAGLALLGHELVHTGQQQAAVQRHGAAGLAAISAASEPPSLEAQAARAESSVLSLFSDRSVPVARQLAAPRADGLAAWTASLTDRTAAPPALSLDATPRALYHQPVTAIQRAVNTFGSVRPSASAAAPSARTPLIGAARGRFGGAAHGSNGAAATPGSVSTAAPTEQPAAAQAALPDVEDLVAQVLRRVKQELRLDHERAGGFLSDVMR